MTSNELQGRTFQFALDAPAICDEFRDTTRGKALSGQPARSATPVGANYRSARRARSRREFAGRLGVVKEEADEAEYWLALTLAGRIVAGAQRVEAAVSGSP